MESPLSLGGKLKMDMQALLIMIVVGLVAGWLAGQVVKVRIAEPGSMIVVLVIDGRVLGQ